MKPGDLVRLILPAPSNFTGAVARVVEIHPTHIMVTVGADPRPMRIDHGLYVAEEPAHHHAGAE